MEVERLVGRVRKSVAGLTGSENETLDRLVGRVRSIRKDVQERTQTAVREAERRAEGIVISIEGRVARAIQPVVRRLDVASQQELIELRDRVAQIEKRVHEICKSAEAA